MHEYDFRRKCIYLFNYIYLKKHIVESIYTIHSLIEKEGSMT